MLLTVLVTAAPVVAAEPRFGPMPAGEVRQRLEAVLKSQAATDTTLADISTATPERALLAALTAVARHGDAELAKILQGLEQGSPSVLTAVHEYIARPGVDPFIAANLRILAGRRLAEQRMYDEAVALLKDVDLSLAIDPAAVFYFRAVSAQGILQVDFALEALEQLNNRTDRVPVRYAATAVLMQEELLRLKEKSLGEIARLMSDSERRLDLGRTGDQVQGVQERIVSGLDELIKKLEAQQNGGGGGSGNSSNSNESSGPAGDSSVKGATAPGETDKKKFSKEGQWGDMPERQQAEAKNLINRNFPSHYRQAIETYFKKLSGRSAAPPQK